MQNSKILRESINATPSDKAATARLSAADRPKAIQAVDNRPLQGWRFWLFNAVLALGNIVVLSNVPGYTSVAPYVAGSLGGVTPSFGSWATTDHMVGLALGLPFARWFSARFGDYRAYAVAFVLYAFASLLCASSETLWLFLPARIALGFVGGVILPIGQALALGEVPERFRTLMVGFWGVMSMTPFTIGVAIATWYAEFASWRMLFISNIVVSLLVAAVVASLLYGRGFARKISRFDITGSILLVAIVYGTQTIFNMGNDFDWLASPILQFALIVVAIALPSFVIWELSERRPVLDLRLFAHRNYAIATTCSVFGFLVIQGLLSLEIGQLQLLNGYSSSLAGLVYLGMIILAAPFVSIMHELNRKIDVRLVSFFCFVGLAVTLTWFGLFDKLASFDQVFWPFLFYGFFIACFFAPLAALAMQGLSGSQLIRAAEELAFLRTVAGSFGISLMAVIQFRRQPFHQLELADHLGGRRFASLDLLGQLTGKLQDAGVSAAAMNKQLGKLMKEQSALLGLNDVFLFGAVVFVALAALIWFARPTPIAPFRRKEELRRLKAEELMEQP
ncbi:MFS transporter [Methylocystis heyeri]|uniref:MFS transporter n=1 Tax=Methylocystis heyeri TaxID=391905 RepID=A0A6B8KK09_9HYPH|nr:MFS transporter [Methylocystis heyeri]QGM47285.1 MFS transporter [Methylocystis heyeri]